jgi:hypothetical protein
MLTMNADGRVLDERGREVTELTERELDGLVGALYPDESALRDERTRARRQKGYTGVSFDCERLQETPGRTEGVKLNPATVSNIGGPRLLSLYLNDFSFALASQELGLRESTLRRWFNRWRLEALEDGMVPSDFSLAI